MRYIISEPVLNLELDTSNEDHGYTEEELKNAILEIVSDELDALRSMNTEDIIQEYLV